MPGNLPVDPRAGLPLDRKISCDGDDIHEPVLCERRDGIPGVPPEVACPHCRGYVRGHQWIGRDTCSILDVFDEPVQPRPYLVVLRKGCGNCNRCGSLHLCPPETS
jgi:hypothetical protein